MPSHLVEVLFQGVWSSLTGGWFYDKNLSVFINTFHMYTWLFLFVLPLAFYIIFPSRFLTWFAYTTIISFVFTVVKLVNYQLNKMFDQNKITMSEKLVKMAKLKRPKKSSAAPTTTTAAVATATTATAIASNQLNTNRPLLTSVQLVRRTSLARSSILRNRNHATTTTTTRGSAVNPVVKASLGGGAVGAGSSSVNAGDDEGIECDSANVVNEHLLSNESQQWSGVRARRNRSNLETRRRHRNNKRHSKNSTSSSSNAEQTNKTSVVESRVENGEVAAKSGEEKSYEELSSIVVDLLKTINQPENILGDAVSLKSVKEKQTKLVKQRSVDDLEESEEPFYLKNEASKEESNLNEPNMVALAASLPLNQNKLLEDLEDNSNRSLFKISEESIAAPSIINFSSTKSNNELQTKAKLAPSTNSATNLTRASRRFLKKEQKSAAQKKTQTTTKTTKPVNLMRRAHSDISFNLFEKIVRKNRLKENDSNMLKHAETCRYNNNYKNDSEFLEKKIETFSMSLSSSTILDSVSTNLKKTGAKSFQNLSTSNNTNFFQQQKLEDLKQFKSTMKSVRVLSRKMNSSEVADLSREFELLFREEELSREEREEYERQGAMPKRVKLASRRKAIKPETSVFVLNETTGESVREPLQYYSELALSRDDDEAEEAVEGGFNDSLTRLRRVTRLSAATTLPTRNLSATAKMIGRDFFNRITNRAGIYRVEQSRVNKQAEFDESEYNSVLDNYDDEVSNYEDDEGGGVGSGGGRDASIYAQTIDPNGHEYEDIDEAFYRKNRANEAIRMNDEARNSDEKVTNNSLNNLDIGADGESGRWTANEESRSVRQPLIEKHQQSQQQEQKNEPASSRTYEEIIVNYMDHEREQTRSENRNHYRLSSSSSSNQVCAKNNFRRSQSSGGSQGCSNNSRHKINTRNRHASTGGITLDSERIVNSALTSSSLGNRGSGNSRRSRRARNNNNNRHSPPLPSLPANIPPENYLNETDPISEFNPTKLTSDDLNQATNQNDYEEVKRKVYKWKLGKTNLAIRIPFDHYFLLLMLDRNKSFVELFFSIFVSVLVSVFASLVIYEQIYDDLFLVVFCFVVASCHYSLLKSVQPDSSSPIHGFNSLTALSRPIYFCILCFVTLLLRRLATDSQTLLPEQHNEPLLFFQKLTLYGFRLSQEHFKLISSGIEIFLLFLPLLFTLGLFPQISTFALCVLEQIDMSLFGGTAMNNLPGAVLSVLRSSFAVLFLAAISTSAIYTIPPSPNPSPAKNWSLNAAANNQFSHSVIFSLFCAFLVLLAYLLSRQNSDILTYLKIVKETLCERRSNNNRKKKKKKKLKKMRRKTAKRDEESDFLKDDEEIRMKSLMSVETSSADAGSKNADKTDYLSVPESFRSPTASNATTTASSTRSLTQLTSSSSSRASSPTCTTNLLEKKKIKRTTTN